MRIKVIAVNAVIVLMCGILSFAIVWQSIGSATGNPEALKRRAQQDAVGAASRLELEGLRMERWLAARAAEPAVREVSAKATPAARGDAATQACDAVANAAKGAFEQAPSLVAVVDGAGRVLGRNGSNLERGEDYGAQHPAFKDDLAKGESGSDVWSGVKGNQLVVSYAPVIEGGKPVGALLMGVPLVDALSRTADAQGSAAIVLVSAAGGDAQIVGQPAATPPDVTALVEAAKADVKGAVGASKVGAVTSNGRVLAVAPLGFGAGKSVALVAVAPTSLVGDAMGMAMPILLVTLLGLALVAAGGWLLGTYLDRPIAVLEEGLLAVLNGQHDKRIELEHAELGGLAFRINQLLNQLMGVEEDTTDSQGRVSNPPPAAALSRAVEVPSSPDLGAAAGASLGAEPEAAYYTRLYGEYIAAKKALGEPTDHITDEAFKSRIQMMEREAQTKQGQKVRYQVQSNGKEVSLLAVPIA